MMLKARLGYSAVPAHVAVLGVWFAAINCISELAGGADQDVQTSAIDQSGQPAIFALAEQAVAPEQALSTFEVLDGFELELAAFEPDVVDPVAMRFDSQGRMWVVEMRDYPSGPASPSEPAKGKIVVLEDRNHDGRFEQRSVFADQLLFPTGLQPTDDGLYVTLAGKLVLMEDTNADLKSDRTSELITDFAQKNPQLRANDPSLLADGWLYVCNSLTSREITDTFNGRSTFSIGSRDLRVNLRTKKLEAIVGPSQFGMSWDHASNRYFCSNRNPCVQVVLDSDQLAAKTVIQGLPTTTDVLPSGNESKVFPISKTWTTSNLHANQFTAACGLMIANLISVESTDATAATMAIVCEPTGNLVHAAKLNTEGIISKSEPLASNKELLSSRDPWFRPVNLTIGPDGSLYIIDMYRAVIEHPEWVPKELKRRPDAELGSDRGRIYRLKSKSSSSSQSIFVEAAFDRQLVELSAETSSTEDFEKCFQSLSDYDAAVAWKVARQRYPGIQEWIPLIVEGLKSDNAKLVFEVAWYANTLSDDFVKANNGLQIAISNAIRNWFNEPLILAALYPLVDNKAGFLQRTIIGFQLNPGTPIPKPVWYKNLISDVANSTYGEQVVDWLNEQIMSSTSSSKVVSHDLLLLNLINGLHRSSMRGRINGSALIKYYVSQQIENVFNGSQSNSSIQSELGKTIGFVEDDRFVELASQLLHETKFPAFTIALLQSVNEGAKVDPVDLLYCFLTASGDIRREAFYAVLSHPVALELLAQKLESSDISVSQFDTMQIELLKNGGRVAEIQNRFKKIFADAIDPNREQLVQRYMSELGETGDLKSGRALFRQHCSACHKMEGHGVQIGPDISDTREQSPLQLITSILDPNRAIDGAYFRYILLTEDGQSIEGILKHETSETISIQLANGTVTDVHKSTLDSVKSTGTSLMPLGFETQLNPQQITDLVYYLKNWRYQ